MEMYYDLLVHGKYRPCDGKRDPYQIDPAKWRSDPKLFPALTYVDLVNYLIFNPSSFYTLKNFQN